MTSTLVTPLPQNNAPADPSLKDLLDLLKKDILLSLNAHHLGTIQSFDATRQTANVSINYKKTFYKHNAATGLYDAVLFDYPLALDCPVIVLGGGGGALTFPISAGDECLVLFNDRDLDNWFQGGAGAAVATPRLHSFADGIALVGLRSLTNVLTGYDATRAVLRNGEGGSTMVGVGPTLIKIANQQFTLNLLLQELLTELQSLVTQIAAITVTSTTPGNPTSPPINAPAIVAVGVQIATTATKIGELLE